LKSLIKALFLPQRKHLLVLREENFGFFFDFAIWAAVAMINYYANPCANLLASIRNSQGVKEGEPRMGIQTFNVWDIDIECLDSLIHFRVSRIWHKVRVFVL